MIFKYLLWIPSATVEPDVMITIVVRSYEKYKKPTYKPALWNETRPIYSDDPTYEPWRESVMTKEKKIFHGGREVIQLNRILRQAIDATCLRTCTGFFKFGSEILYRDNILTFPVESVGPFRKEKSWMKGEFYNPVHEKPELGQLYDWPQAIPYIMEQIRQGVPIKELAGLNMSSLWLFVLGIQVD